MWLWRVVVVGLVVGGWRVAVVLGATVEIVLRPVAGGWVVGGWRVGGCGVTGGGGGGVKAGCRWVVGDSVVAGESAVVGDSVVAGESLVPGDSLIVEDSLGFLGIFGFGGF
ncbi:hypothetical protein HanRHA438_Chr16g0754901 [Helianthus annuus]|nr:hypothetical protein HanRHA438_Chr16g0754901 [Helianthus annuus]